MHASRKHALSGSVYTKAFFNFLREEPREITRKENYGPTGMIVLSVMIIMVIKCKVFAKDYNYRNDCDNDDNGDGDNSDSIDDCDNEDDGFKDNNDSNDVCDNDDGGIKDNNNNNSIADYDDADVSENSKFLSFTFCCHSLSTLGAAGRGFACTERSAVGSAVSSSVDGQGSSLAESLATEFTLERFLLGVDVPEVIVER